MKAGKPLIEYPILIKLDYDNNYLILEDKASLGSGQGLVARIGSIGEWTCTMGKVQA